MDIFWLKDLFFALLPFVLGFGIGWLLASHRLRLAIASVGLWLICFFFFPSVFGPSIVQVTGYKDPGPLWIFGSVLLGMLGAIVYLAFDFVTRWMKASAICFAILLLIVIVTRSWISSDAFDALAQTLRSFTNPKTWLLVLFAFGVGFFFTATKRA